MYFIYSKHFLKLSYLPHSKQKMITIITKENHFLACIAVSLFLFTSLLWIKELSSKTILNFEQSELRIPLGISQDSHYLIGRFSLERYLLSFQFFIIKLFEIFNYIKVCVWNIMHTITVIEKKVFAWIMRGVFCMRFNAHFFILKNSILEYNITFTLRQPENFKTTEIYEFKLRLVK